MVPVLMKELRTRMRGWRTPSVLTGYLCILAAVCYAVLQTNLASTTFDNSQASRVGITLFTYLATIQGVLLLFIVPATTAGSISGERQRQTLDLLLVTRLTSLGITTGKMIAALSFDLLLLVCSLPIFSLVFLFGGVGPDRVAEVFVLFVAYVFCFGSIGLLVSVLTRGANAATVVTYVIVLLLTLGLALATLYLNALGFSVNDGSLQLPLTAYFDPAFGLAAVMPSPDGGTVAGFAFNVWQVNVLFASAVTVICVALSAALLRRHRA